MRILPKRQRPLCNASKCRIAKAIEAWRCRRGRISRLPDDEDTRMWIGYRCGNSFGLGLALGRIEASIVPLLLPKTLSNALAITQPLKKMSVLLQQDMRADWLRLHS